MFGPVGFRIFGVVVEFFFGGFPAFEEFGWDLGDVIEERVEALGVVGNGFGEVDASGGA